MIGDDPSRPFQTHERTADWTYVRCTAVRAAAGPNYSRAELATWQRRIAAWRRETEVYVYANNDQEGFAAHNAAWLRDRLGRGRSNRLGAR